MLDISEPIDKILQKHNVCLETIDRLGASGIPTITALNKIDLINEEERTQKLEALREKTKNPILISAKRQINLDLLKKEILRILENYVEAHFSVPLTGKSMPFISWVHEKTDIAKENYTNDSIEVVFGAPLDLSEQVRRKVEDLHGKFETDSKTK
jgi:50S ribosomal subunit-associated GTPase HflX